MLTQSRVEAHEHIHAPLTSCLPGNLRPISAVAIAFKGGKYRQASIVLLAKALGSSTDIETPLRSEASVRVRVRDQTRDGYNPVHLESSSTAAS